MTGQAASTRSSTPPKGRPTRARNETWRRRGPFGPTAQWVAVIGALVLAFLLLFFYIDGRNDASGAGSAPVVLTAA